MKQIFFILIFGIIQLASSCRMESKDPYIQNIIKSRYSKDSFYKGSPESPFDTKARRELVAIKYYNPDSNYRINARLELFPHPDSIKMQVTNSPAENYFKLGIITFNLKGHPCKLAVYQSGRFINDPRYSDELFCPFTDLTNGSETHEGGRFLDLTRVPGSNKVVIDFNYAYNPYCAYNKEYSCPIPPEENHLEFKVEAGEKAYKTGKVSIFK